MSDLKYEKTPAMAEASTVSCKNDAVSSCSAQEVSMKVSPEHKEYLRRVRMGKIRVRFTQALILIAALALWEISARANIVDSFITSQPSRVVKTIISLYEEGVLFQHIGITCLETIVGFVLGTLLGTMIAVILWWSEFLSEVLEPYLVVLNSLPKIALGPVFIVWIGAGPAAIIVKGSIIDLFVEYAKIKELKISE